MRAVIVAAGRGTRLRPLTDEKPKCLIEIGGKSLLERQLDSLEASGIAEIVVVVGHLAEQVEKRCRGRATIAVNPEYAETNSLLSLWHARQKIDGDFIYLHSDIVFDPKILKRAVEAEVDCSMVVDAKHCDDEDMKVIVDDDMILKIDKAVPLHQASGEFIGIAAFRGQGVKRLLEALEWCAFNEEKNSYFETAVQRMIAEGETVSPIYTENDRWVEIDFIDDLQRARELFEKAEL